MPVPPSPLTKPFAANSARLYFGPASGELTCKAVSAGDLGRRLFLVEEQFGRPVEFAPRLYDPVLLLAGVVPEVGERVLVLVVVAREADAWDCFVSGRCCCDEY